MLTYIELLKSTRAEIVNLLKRQGTMSVESLATELEISKVAVRRHLDQLEDQGFIGHSSERCERGRPRFVYSLTDEGMVSFRIGLLTLRVIFSRSLVEGMVTRPLTRFSWIRPTRTFSCFVEMSKDSISTPAFKPS
ncbi:MAG: ArsR family transcriptional regulator [Blastocatellia bacterium]|nr:ArsR family transcriptional regulator [Blastocatellia bacterium]